MIERHSHTMSKLSNSLASNQGAAEHQKTDQIAEDTDGRASYNSNGLEQAMDKALDEGSTC